MKSISPSRSIIEISSFSKEQTDILKGTGILLIVLHNFFHNMTPFIGENQFTYHPDRFSRFYLTIVENPLEILRAALSYFGHYGVQIFIFFSAYGLTRKYRFTKLKIDSFLKGRVEKIYLSFLVCVMIYVLLGIIKEEFLAHEQVLHWDSLLWKVLLISSFIPNQALMPVGPWWFIPFIFQVYLFYPIIFVMFKRYGVEFLVVISLASILAKIFLNPYLNRYGLNINFMILGHLPVICLGIFLASREKIRLRMDLIAISFVLFVVGNFNFYAWAIEDLTFTVSVLAVSIFLINNCPGQMYVTAPLVFYGGISFHLFMVNGFLRTPFHNFAESYNTWWIDNMAALVSLIFSTCFAIMLIFFDNKMRSLFSRGS